MKKEHERVVKTKTEDGGMIEVEGGALEIVKPTGARTLPADETLIFYPSLKSFVETQNKGGRPRQIVPLKVLDGRVSDHQIIVNVLDSTLAFFKNDPSRAKPMPANQRYLLDSFVKAIKEDLGC